MKLKVKDMDISTGGPMIAIINQQDAKKLDLHELDRVMISRGTRKCIAIIDIAVSKKAVPPGSLGFFEEVLDGARSERQYSG